MHGARRTTDRSGPNAGNDAEGAAGACTAPAAQPTDPAPTPETTPKAQPAHDRADAQGSCVAAMHTPPERRVFPAAVGMLPVALVTAALIWRRHAARRPDGDGKAEL